MEQMTDKRFLNPWQRFTYFLCTFGNSFGTILITSYALLFMTDYVGMNAGVVGMLIAASKLLDGISDVIAGAVIDHTKSRFGRARSWMLRMLVPMAVLQVLMFTIPAGWGNAAKYIYFFVIYTVFNAIIYTMYGNAYNSLTLFITRSKKDQVSLSIANFAGGTIAGAVIAAIYITLIENFGGSTRGWQITALIFDVIYIVMALICIFSVKELPRIEFEEKAGQENGLKIIKDNLKYLLSNKYFLMQLGIMILYMGTSAMTQAALPYYAIYVLGNTEMQGIYSLTCIGIILGLFMAPLLMKKLSIYKMNLYSRIAGCVLYLGVIAGGVTKNVTVLLIFNFLFYMSCGPYLGSVTTLIAEISRYTLRREKVSIDASVSSCNSMGTKVGNSLGVVIVGWLLAAVHYDGTLDVQPMAAQNMITFIFAVLPLVLYILITILMGTLRVEKANREWDAAHPKEAAELQEKLAAKAE